MTAVQVGAAPTSKYLRRMYSNDVAHKIKPACTKHCSAMVSAITALPVHPPQDRCFQIRQMLLDLCATAGLSLIRTHTVLAQACCKKLTPTKQEGQRASKIGDGMLLPGPELACKSVDAAYTEVD